MSSANVRSAAFSSSIFLTACITVVWSRPPNLRPISGQRAGGELLAQIHRHLARPRHGAGAARGMHVGEADVVMLGDPLLDLVDGDAAVIGAQ